MDKFSLYERNLKWDFNGSAIPTDFTTEISGSAAVSAKNLENGGSLNLTSSAYGSVSGINFPAFVPNKYDEIRLKTLISRNHDVIIMRLGLYSNNLQNGLYFTRDSKIATLIAGVVNGNTPVTAWNSNMPTWFEIVWKPNEGAAWYLNERLVGKIDKPKLPDPNIAYKQRITCTNTENPSTVDKKIDIYLSQLDLIVYSK
ncbi:hypothetical protein [Bacillus sp. 03113]|uniref:hypothetical protein n=1 Tax=Bacillus sp. 03113 TaxID=2578211 RepID=UPI0011423965|nr:hypothetical protein [Bacillus sp. 03113]